MKSPQNFVRSVGWRWKDVTLGDPSSEVFEVGQAFLGARAGSDQSLRIGKPITIEAQSTSLCVYFS
jgi:hypothetical protein